MKKSLTAGLLIFAFLVASVPMANAQTTGAADDQALIQQLEAVIASLTQQIATLIQQRLAASTGANHLEVNTEDTGTISSDNSSEHSDSNSTSDQSSNGPTAIVRGVTITESVLNGVPCGPNSLNQTITFKPGQPFCLRFSAQNHDEGLPHGALDDQSKYYDRVSIDTPTNTQFTFSLGNNQWDSHWNQNDNVYVQATPSAALQNGTYPLRFHVAARKCVISKVLGSTISTDCGDWTEAYVSANVVVDNGQGTVTTTGPSATIYATPSIITAGQSAQLYATNNLLNQNGASCTLNGQPTALGGGSNGSGMSPMTITPSQTTTYTYTCTDSQGRSGSATATVTVTAATAATPTVNLTAIPSTITAGQSSSLFVSFVDPAAASGAQMSCQVNNKPITEKGGYVVTPSQTTTYTATCTNTVGQSASGSATVTVGSAAAAQASVTLAVNGSHGPVSVTSGSSPTLSWTLGGSISSCSIAASSGKYSYLVNNSGSVALSNITESTTITAVCNNGAATDQMQVNVSAPVNTTSSPSSSAPVLTSFAASPSSITAGQPVTVSLYADLSNAANKGIACTVSPLVGSGLMNNNVTVYPGSSTTFTATCTNSAGLTTTKTSSVTVSQQTTTSTTSSVPSVSVSASPSSISAGGSTTITWSSTNTSYCSWTAGSKMNPNGTAATLATSGSQTVTPVAGTDYSASVGVASYYVSCYNGSGGATGSTNVTVNTTGQTSAAYDAIEALIQSISASIANLSR